MKDSIKRIVGRLKKYIWAILIICVAMPILGWFMPTGNGQSEYTSEAIIKLGNYETSYLTNADQLVSLLSNEASFKQILPDVWEEEVTDKLAVSSTPSKLLVLSLTGKTEEEALNNLTTIVDGFMKLDQSSFEEKAQLLNQAFRH